MLPFVVHGVVAFDEGAPRFDGVEGDVEIGRDRLPPCGLAAARARACAVGEWGFAWSYIDLGRKPAGFGKREMEEGE